MLDFCFFGDKDSNKPEQRAASAYMRLVKDGVLPPWAMFCFGDFKHAKEASAPASEVAIIGDAFILLEPTVIDNGYEGLLIAEQVCSAQVVKARFQEADITVKIPEFEGFTFAKAGVEVDLVNPDLVP